MKFFYGLVAVSLIGSVLCAEESEQSSSGKEYLPPSNSSKEYLPPSDSNEEYLPPVTSTETNLDETHNELGDILQERFDANVDNLTEKEPKDLDATAVAVSTAAVSAVPVSSETEKEDLASATENNEVLPAYSLESDGYHYRAPANKRFFY